MNLFKRTKFNVYEPKTYIYQYNDNDFRLVHLKCVKLERLGKNRR